MKKPKIPGSPAKDCRLALLFFVITFISIQGLAQTPGDWKLEKMPADLETDYALSSLPAHVRKDATVYLLDPEKGYYIARQGTNAFMCFVVRTEWEWPEFRQDLATAISYDAEGTKMIFPTYIDVAMMRASGKFTASQIKDTMTARYANGTYKAPSKPGLSYMLAPIMRTHAGSGPDAKVATISVPHYMFYAPYTTAADIGGNSPDGGPMILGDGKGPHGYLIVPAGAMEKAKMMDENKELLKRLIAYRSYFNPGQGATHHTGH